jgi:hypothetical protein
MGTENGAESARAARERAAPPRHGRARQRPAARTPANRLPRGALGRASNEDLLQDLAANLHGVVGSRLLKGGLGRERRVGRLPALVARYADVLGDGVEEYEVAEVVAVLREAAVGPAAQAVRRARKVESPFPRQVSGEFGIGLERRAFRAYRD